MIKATVDGTTKFFETIGKAIQWVRTYVGEALSVTVYDAKGNVYYTC